MNAHALAAVNTREPTDDSYAEFVRHVAAADCATSAFVGAVREEVGVGR